MHDQTGRNTAGASAPPLSMGLKIGYSMGNLSLAMQISIQGVALFYFNQVVGVPAHLVSISLGVIIFIDALWDPAIGQWSDRCQSRFGRRHPFLFAGMVLVPMAIYLRWHPPTGWSELALMAYILATGLFMNLATSLFDVPSAAMAPELVSDYHERTVLMGYRSLFMMIGMALGTVLIYGVFLRSTPEHPVGQLNREAYGPMSLAIAAVAFVGMATLALSTRRRAASFHKAQPSTTGIRAQMGEVMATLKNRNFVIALLASAFVGISAGIQAGTSLYINTYFWAFATKQIMMVMLVTIAGAPIAFLIAPKLGRRFGKRNACIGTLFASGLFMALPISLRLLGLFPVNGSPMLLPSIFLTMMVATVMSLSASIMVSSMVADLVEDSQVKTGRRSEGLILSADLLPQKVLAAFAVIIPGLMLSWIGFPKDAKPGQVAPQIISTMGLSYMLIVLVCTLASVFTWSKFQIDEDRHARNLKRIRTD